MGRELFTLRATAALSRHNSKKDDLDNAAWNFFVQRVNEVAALVYEDDGLFIDVMAEGDLPTSQW